MPVRVVGLPSHRSGVVQCSLQPLCAAEADAAPLRSCRPAAVVRCVPALVLCSCSCDLSMWPRITAEATPS